MIVLLRPAWLLVLPLALALGWAWWRANSGAAPWRRAVDAELLGALTADAPPRARAPLALAALALGLASLALAGPSWRAQPAPPARALSARVVVLDLSPSMNAVDLAPSRIARARRAAADLLRGARGERLGLVVFGADAFAAAPLVSDAAALTHLLPGLSPATVPRAGSRPDLALGLARRMLEGAGIVSGDVILVGDSAGGGRTLGAARELEREGFPVSVLAVGTPAGGPVERADGSLVRTAAGGGILVVKPELAALERVAREGGGDFRLLPAEGPTPAFAAAARVWAQGGTAPARGAKVRIDDGAWLALLALPFAALLFRRGWLMGLAVLALGLASAPRPALAFDWHALWQRADQQAASAYAGGGARERVTALARLAPDSPWRAALLYRSGRYAEAAALYAKRDDAEAWYNRANALALEGRLQEALGAYDAALERSPSMRDARANRALVRAAITRRFANEQGRSNAARRGKTGPGRAPRASERRANEHGTARRQERSAPAGPERRAPRTETPAASGGAPRTARRRLDALLAEVPDHPGELLANRFARELRLRGDWTRDPGEPW